MVWSVVGCECWSFGGISECVWLGVRKVDELVAEFWVVFFGAS